MHNKQYINFDEKMIMMSQPTHNIKIGKLDKKIKRKIFQFSINILQWNETAKKMKEIFISFQKYIK